MKTALTTGFAASLSALVFSACVSAQTPPAYPPAAEEALHIVRHRSAHFMIYTNYLPAGQWTQFHSHRNDLLALIAADTTASAQTPDAPIKAQRAPAGTAVFFPYADAPAPYVHRVGVEASDSAPFINVGLEFFDPPTTQCAPGKWASDADATLTRNRRGVAYRLSVAAGATLSLPSLGRALLLVPLLAPSERALLRLDGETAHMSAGEFRFYDDTQPDVSRQIARAQRLDNLGTSPVDLSLFVAC
jgi:hypothetical protein